MVFWSGFGFLAIIIPAIVLIVTQIVIDFFLGKGFYTNHYIIQSFGLYLSSIFIWVIGKYLQKRKAKVLIDKETGKEVIIDYSNHTFFFIKLHYWSIACIVFGLYITISNIIN